MSWENSFIVLGVLTLILTIHTKTLLRKKGFDVSWVANINQWGQLFELIKLQTKISDKLKYSILLFFLVFSFIGGLISMINV